MKRPKGAAAPLEQLLAQLAKEQRRISSLIHRATRRHAHNEISRYLFQLRMIDGLLTLAKAASAARPQGPPPVAPYTISSLMLAEAYGRLTADEKENFFFLTGPEVAGSLVLSQIVLFSHDRRTVMGVAGNPQATHDLLIRLELFGHRLCGHAHSHPGRGPEATLPSDVDESFQARLERGGYKAVGAIFSRDGWVRFYRSTSTPEVFVFGEGVEKHETNLYRLTNLVVPCRPER